MLMWEFMPNATLERWRSAPQYSGTLISAVIFPFAPNVSLPFLFLVLSPSSIVSFEFVFSVMK